MSLLLTFCQREQVTGPSLTSAGQRSTTFPPERGRGPQHSLPHLPYERISQESSPRRSERSKINISCSKNFFFKFHSENVELNAHPIRKDFYLHFVKLLGNHLTGQICNDYCIERCLVACLGRAGQNGYLPCALEAAEAGGRGSKIGPRLM